MSTPRGEAASVSVSVSDLLLERYLARDLPRARRVEIDRALAASAGLRERLAVLEREKAALLVIDSPERFAHRVAVEVATRGAAAKRSKAMSTRLFYWLAPLGVVSAGILVAVIEVSRVDTLRPAPAPAPVMGAREGETRDAEPTQRRQEEHAHFQAASPQAEAPPTSRAQPVARGAATRAAPNAFAAPVVSRAVAPPAPPTDDETIVDRRPGGRAQRAPAAPKQAAELQPMKTSVASPAPAPDSALGASKKDERTNDRERESPASNGREAGEAKAAPALGGGGVGMAASRLAAHQADASADSSGPAAPVPSAPSASAPAASVPAGSVAASPSEPTAPPAEEAQAARAAQPTKQKEFAQPPPHIMVQGGLEMPQVARIVRAQVAAVRALWSQPSAGQPRLRVQFVIDQKGNVEVARVLTAEVPIEIAARMAATIRAWRFPASPTGKPTTVVVVF